MKKNILIVGIFLCFYCISANCQSLTFHDPAVQNARIQLDAQKETGEITFEYVQLLSDYRNDEMPVRMVLSLANVRPVDGIYSIHGAYAEKFNWKYDESMNYLLATQKGTLPKNLVGEIKIAVNVTNKPSCESNRQVGLNVNIQPAPCMNGINELDNDNVSIHTCNPILTNLLEIDKLSYKVYPNPVNEILTVQLNKLTANLELEMLDVQGKIVYTKKYENIDHLQLDVAKLAGGTYSLNLKSEDDFHTERVVIIE